MGLGVALGAELAVDDLALYHQVPIRTPLGARMRRPWPSSLIEDESLEATTADCPIERPWALSSKGRHPGNFLFEASSTAFIKNPKGGFQVIKVRKDGDYHWKTGEVMPLGAKCLIKRAIQNKQAEIDVLEEEMNALRGKEKKGMKEEKEFVAISQANADMQFPHRMSNVAEAANAGQANAEITQDSAIAEMGPLLKRKKVLVQELEQLEFAHENGEDPTVAAKAKSIAGGKKGKKPPPKPRIRPDMVAAEEEMPAPGPANGGISVMVPDVTTPAPPGMAAVQVLNVGGSAPSVADGGAYEYKSGMPEITGSTYVDPEGPSIDIGSRKEDADLDFPQEATDESAIPLPPPQVLAPLLALVPGGPAAVNLRRETVIPETRARRRRNFL